MIGHVAGTWRFVTAYGRSRWQVACTTCGAGHLLTIVAARRLACFACGATGKQAPIKTTRAPAPLVAPKPAKAATPPRVPMAPPGVNDSWHGLLPLNERGEIDWSTSQAWTKKQLAAVLAEDDARMECEASGHWLDVVLASINLPDGDDADGEDRYPDYVPSRAWVRRRIGALAAA